MAEDTPETYTFTLAEPVEIEHTYRRPTCGPSGFAYVKFRCEPASELTFSVVVEWPMQLRQPHIGRIEQAVKNGVATAFAASPAHACKVTLTAIGWDDVQSSEFAFLNAAAEALVSLASSESKWTVRVGSEFHRETKCRR